MVDLIQAQRRARPLVRAILRRYPDDIDDVLQSAALNAWRFREQFHGRSAFQTWFTSIAKNLAKMHLRRYRGQTDREISLETLVWAGNGEDLDVEDTLKDARPSPLDMVNFAQRSSVLHEEINKLCHSLRQEGRLELAGNMPGNDSTRKARRFRLKRYLRTGLEKRGITR